MILGITGCPGSGKSLLAAELAHQGWQLIDADKIGRAVVEYNRAVLDALAVAFGSDIIDTDGKLRRRLLGQRAFMNADSIKKLNDIVHPILIDDLKSDVSSLRSSGENGVVDCALIFEWGIEKFFDRIICVAADEKLRKRRIMKRDNRSEEETEKIFSAQLPEIEKIQKADIVVKNDDSVNWLKIYGNMFSILPDLLSNFFR
ncbi:MAG: dephospho-CoA kinase [Candidatus Latescibacteria bacterium]|nr:dephospho-CoA kinase [Candidatus Latescibacterota bacterium]